LFIIKKERESKEDEDDEDDEMVEEDEHDEDEEVNKIKMAFSSGYRSSEPLKADDPQSSNLYKINESSNL
jgi:hypothetical protein